MVVSSALWGVAVYAVMSGEPVLAPFAVAWAALYTLLTLRGWVAR